LEDFDGGFERTVEEKFAPPVEDIGFTGIHMGGNLVLVDGREEIAGFFLDFGEEIVEFRGVFFFEEGFYDLPRFREAIGQKVGEGEVVAVVIGGWIGVLGALEIGNGFGEFARAGVEFAEIVIGVVGVRLERDGFFELLFGEIGLAKREQIVAEVSVRRSGVGIKADGLFKMLPRSRVLRLGGVNQTEQFVDFKTFRYPGKDFLKLRGGFGIAARLVLSDGGLEVAVEITLLGRLSRRLGGTGKNGQESRGHKQSPESHDGIMVAPS